MATHHHSTTEADCRPKERGTPSCKRSATDSQQCPSCGALECLCRPRFFAGQLLTEQDLNRLDQYIKRKHQLHNRNLHGWGVVNGLMLVCDDCDGVRLTRGYAVSPCGDDIVVCEDVSVPICDLIRKCRREREPDCRPFRRPPTGNCSDLEEEWVVTIRYEEFSTRGITALTDPGCSAGKACGCGKGCGCGATGSGCGCGRTGSSCSCGKAQATKPRGAPAQCEPTIVCEGFAFDVYKKPEPDKQDERAPRFGGPLVERLRCCIQPLIDGVPAPPTNTNDPVAWHQWCCRFKASLKKYLEQYDRTNCALLQALECVTCPRANDQEFWQHFAQSLEKLVLIWAEALFNCICLALLPPAPEATHDVRVPLATVRVRAKDCKVLSVCNWTTERKLLVGWPSIAYWLSIVPIGQWLHALLDQICCRTLVGPDCDELDGRLSGVGATVGVQPSSAVPSAVAPAPVAPGATAPAPNPPAPPPSSAQPRPFLGAERFNPVFERSGEVRAFLDLVGSALVRRKTPLDALAFLSSVSRFDAPGAAGDSKLSEVERNNIPQFLALNVFGRSLGNAALETPWVGALARSVAGKQPKDDDDTKSRLAALEAELAAQKAEIARLKRHE